MAALIALIAFCRQIFTDWENVRIAELQFWHRDAARLTLMSFAALSLMLLIARLAAIPRPGRDRVALPAILRWARPSYLSFVRHGPLFLFLGGLPFLGLALADPYTSLTQQTVSFPGRRIALLLDASSSMITEFQAARLNAKAPIDAAFFTTVGAAEHFVRLRMQGKYRDLIALIEFGDEAYVITPFTNDYENILLSTALISDFVEWGKFPNKGTTIARAIDQSVLLFRAFGFLKASGNLMVIISDGQDTEVTEHGKSLEDILAGAVETKIPVYFVRVAYNLKLGSGIADQLWQDAVERTGGRFYAGADEQTIMHAMQEINKVAVGEISTKQYSSQRPQFSPFALIAAAMWTFALLLKLTVPYFQKFP